ncbi:MAG: SdpI family protein [Ruminococcaceae bacterium]|nr:SdpI family protein [Oscillospiraceae bacterium]
MANNTFNNVLFLIGELPTPLIIMAFAIAMRNNPPRFGDNTGYNTKRSRKSAEAWDFAQNAYGRYATKAFAVMSAVALAVGLIAIFLNIGEDAGFAVFMAVTTVQVAVLAAVIFVIERQPERNFN